MHMDLFDRWLFTFLIQGQTHTASSFAVTRVISSLQSIPKRIAFNNELLRLLITAFLLPRLSAGQLNIDLLPLSRRQTGSYNLTMIPMS